MTRTNERLAALAVRSRKAPSPDARPCAVATDAAARPGAGGAEPACRRPDAVPLPEALTWSATLDPHDDTHEIEITDEMVNLAIASMDGEQCYPFRREAGTPPPVARTVTRADVIEFPGGR